MLNMEWTYEQYLDRIDRAKERTLPYAYFNMEHCTYISSERITRWATESGYTTKETEKNIVVTF